LAHPPPSTRDRSASVCGDSTRSISLSLRRRCSKVDTQVYEDHVIAGAPLILSTVAILECELSLAHLYEGQPSFRSMIDRASHLGFELVDIDPFFRERATGRVLSMDAIFVRDRRDPLRDAG
jgi:hypothetical protein